MAQVLSFPGVRKARQGSDSPLYQAQDKMLEASELLSQFGEIELEVAWLLEDLADFLVSRAEKAEKVGAELPAADQGEIAEVINLFRPVS